MTRRRLLLLLLVAAPLTVAVYGVVLVVTAFMACGISGCGGGGYGPSYGPVETQVGLAMAGTVLLPIVLLALPGWPVPAKAAAGAAAVIAGTVLAMALLDLAPHGCPRDHDRVTSAPTEYGPGGPTCSPHGDTTG